MQAKHVFGSAQIIGLLAALCLPSLVHAQSEGPSGVTGLGDPTKPTREDTMETARGLGMGSGARAGAMAMSALAYNPANLGLTKAYHIEAFSTIIPGDDTSWTIGSGVVDSTTSKLSLGTSFRGTFGGENREYKGWDWRSAIGLTFAKQFGMGIAVRWSSIKPRKDGDDQPKGPRLEAITMDAALRFTPTPWLNIAGLGYNLIKTDSPLAPQMAGGSVSIAPMESFDFGGDVLVDLSTFEDPKIIGGAGVEYLAGGQVPIRAGYRRDQGRDLNQITASIGWAKQKFGVETALRQDLSGDDKETYLLISARFVVK